MLIGQAVRETDSAVELVTGEEGLDVVLEDAGHPLLGIP